MDKDDLRKLAGKFKVPLGTIEKDYAVTNLLLIISHFPKINQMIFKGGTAIKKMYFHDARFSEDIDFTCREDISNDLFKLLKDGIKENNLNFKEVKSLETKGNSKKFTVKYDDLNHHPNSVKVDPSLREEIIEKAENFQILHIYNDLPTNIKILTMSLKEIMSEKIRALIYSRQPRHLYDIWYLLNQGISIDLALTNKKIALYNEQFDIDMLLESINDIKNGWKSDLRTLLPQEPPLFDEVSNSVIKVISSNMK